MTAVTRGMEMMQLPMKNLPPLALAFARHLGQKIGLCMEVYLTAYRIYAQCVEGLPCDDPGYFASPEHYQWFAANQQADVAEIVKK